MNFPSMYYIPNIKAMMLFLIPKHFMRSINSNLTILKNRNLFSGYVSRACSTAMAQNWMWESVATRNPRNCIMYRNGLDARKVNDVILAIILRIVCDMEKYVGKKGLCSIYIRTYCWYTYVCLYVLHLLSLKAYSHTEFRYAAFEKKNIFAGIFHV